MSSSVKRATEPKTSAPSITPQNSAWSKVPAKTTSATKSQRGRTPAKDAAPATHSRRQSTLGPSTSVEQNNMKLVAVSSGVGGSWRPSANSISFGSIDAHHSSVPTTPTTEKTKLSGPVRATSQPPPPTSAQVPAPASTKPNHMKAVTPTPTPPISVANNQAAVVGTPLVLKFTPEPKRAVNIHSLFQGGGRTAIPPAIPQVPAPIPAPILSASVKPNGSQGGGSVRRGAVPVLGSPEIKQYPYHMRPQWGQQPYYYPPPGYDPYMQHWRPQQPHRPPFPHPYQHPHMAPHVHGPQGALAPMAGGKFINMAGPFVPGARPRASIRISAPDGSPLTFESVARPLPKAPIGRAMLGMSLQGASQPATIVKETKKQRKARLAEEKKRKEQEEKYRKEREGKVRAEMEKVRRKYEAKENEEKGEAESEENERIKREKAEERSLGAEIRAEVKAEVEVTELMKTKLKALVEAEDVKNKANSTQDNQYVVPTSVLANMRVVTKDPNVINSPKSGQNAEIALGGPSYDQDFSLRFDKSHSRFDRNDQKLFLEIREILGKPDCRRWGVDAILNELSVLIGKVQPDPHRNLWEIFSHLALEIITQHRLLDFSVLCYAMVCRGLMLSDMARGQAFFEGDPRFHHGHPFQFCDIPSKQSIAKRESYIETPSTEGQTQPEPEGSSVQFGQFGAPNGGFCCRIHLVVLELFRMQIFSVEQIHQYAGRATNSSALLSDCLSSLSDLLEASIHKVKETEMGIIVSWMNSITLTTPLDEAIGPRFQAIIDIRTSLCNRTSSSGSTKTCQDRALSPIITSGFIKDINMVSYPNSIKPPDAHLNATSACSKFRYDRPFLLQFMSLCRAKPDRLPLLDSIGLDPFKLIETQPGGRQTVHRGAISMNGKTTVQRQGSSKLELGNISQSDRVAHSMTSSSPASWRLKGIGLQETTPAIGRPILATQNTSQGSDYGEPIETKRTMSQGGKNWNDEMQESEPRATPVVQTDISLPVFVTPPQKGPNRWTARSADTIPGPFDFNTLMERKVRALLNKLTVDKFGYISDQIAEWMKKGGQNESGLILLQVIKLVIGQAKNDVGHSGMYARICRKIMWRVSAKVQDKTIQNADGRPIMGSLLFQKYLLQQCQEEFDRGWSANGNDATGRETEGRTFEAAKARHQSLGLVRFIGELFKIQMLTERMIHESLKKLVSNLVNSDQDIERLCVLLVTVGQSLDSTWGKEDMNSYFERIKETISRGGINSRVQFALQDIVKLRALEWQRRINLAPLMTSTVFYYPPPNNKS